MRGTSDYLDRPGRLFKAGLAPVGEKRVFGVHPDGPGGWVVTLLLVLESKNPNLPLSSRL